MNDISAPVLVWSAPDKHDECNDVATELRLLAARLDSEARNSRGPQIDFQSLDTENLPNFRERVRAAKAACKDRAGVFDGDYLGDPNWAILLDLFEAHLALKSRCIKSACIASGAPPTTALRYIADLCAQGLAEKVPDISDGRRTLLSLTSAGLKKMMKYFSTHSS